MDDSIPQKRCTQCSQVKPLDAFHKLPISRFSPNSKTLGRFSRCKDCGNKTRNNHRKIFGRNNHVPYEVRRRKNMRLKYGTTLEEYQLRLDAQNGVCAICHQPEIAIAPKTGLVKPLAIDHNHVTGKKRGLLCQACNLKLGVYENNIALYQKYEVYLECYR